MLNAHRVRRKFFQQYGAKATDHALTNFETTDLNENDCQNLLDKALSNNLNKQESGFFKGQILKGQDFEAQMSIMRLILGNLSSARRLILAGVATDIDGLGLFETFGTSSER